MIKAKRTSRRPSIAAEWGDGLAKLTLPVPRGAATAGAAVAASIASSSPKRVCTPVRTRSPSDLAGPSSRCLTLMLPLRPLRLRLFPDTPTDDWPATAAEPRLLEKLPLPDDLARAASSRCISTLQSSCVRSDDENGKHSSSSGPVEYASSLLVQIFVVPAADPAAPQPSLVMIMGSSANDSAVGVRGGDVSSIRDANGGI